MTKSAGLEKKVKSTGVEEERHVEEVNSFFPPHSQMTDSKAGVVFDIQRFSVHDGPGIRTTVFLKGCPLRCWWCHNPESFHPMPEIFYLSSNCIGCQRCLLICPKKALFRVDSKIRFFQSRCNLCGLCVEACNSQALVWVGKKMSLDEVLGKILRDRVYYKYSDGGVTLSGGEPLNQPDFASEILRECQKNGIHTALDTCGFCNWEDMEKALEFVDLILFDLKEMRDQRHKELTGVSNSIIKQNLKRLVKLKSKVVLRVPVIPEINDSPDNFRSMVEFLVNLPEIERVELLPYNPLTPAKYEKFGMKMKFKKSSELACDDLVSLARIFSDAGFPVDILGRKHSLSLRPKPPQGEKIYEKRFA